MLIVAVAPLALASDNGLALTPPMGWRSWNCYHGSVTQELLEGIMDKMANKSGLVDGTPTSLADLGYINCGLDDNWQACGTGYLKSFHDEAGNPLVNLKTFPSMKGMTDHGHKLGLRVGWVRAMPAARCLYTSNLLAHCSLPAFRLSTVHEQLYLLRARVREQSDLHRHAHARLCAGGSRCWIRRRQARRLRPVSVRAAPSVRCLHTSVLACFARSLLTHARSSPAATSRSGARCSTLRVARFS